MVESLTREECLAKLALDTVGRVSASKNALPVIVPVVYVRDAGNLVFHAPLDSAFARSCDKAVVAFEVGELSTAGAVGWSVQVVGVASLLNQDGLEEDQSATIALERVTGREVHS